MNILYNDQKVTTEVFNYKIYQGGSLSLKVSNGSDRFVEIVFENKKFKEVRLGSLLENGIDRSMWHVLGAIAEKIKEIEYNYTAPREASNSTDH